MGKQPGGFWFDDDPEWEILRRRTNNEPVPRHLKKSVEPPKIRREPRTTTPVKADKKEVVVSIKLAIPKLRLPDMSRVYAHKKMLYIGSAAVGVFGLSILGFKVFGSGKADGDPKPTSATAQAQQDFQPLLPLPNATSADGQAQKQDYRYDEQRQLLGYSTEYNGSSMTVSQQPIPENLKSDRDALKKVADSIGAKDSISTQKGTSYIATNENKEQTAVVINNGVLVFIRANKQLDTDEWQFYINQLRPSDN